MGMAVSIRVMFVNGRIQTLHHVDTLSLVRRLIVGHCWRPTEALVHDAPLVHNIQFCL